MCLRLRYRCPEDSFDLLQLTWLDSPNLIDLFLGIDTYETVPINYPFFAKVNDKKPKFSTSRIEVENQFNLGRRFFRGT